MSRSDILIDMPDGRRYLRATPADTSRILSEWLETEHLPLNTRCGGRGLCRSCLVEVDGTPRRACQITCAQLPADGASIRIPEASVRDQSLNGVSSFEIGTHSHALRRRPGIGLALDIGTTTVAAALWDLATGKCLAGGSAANEQRRYGDNVLSRIDHAVTQGGACPKLQAALVRDALGPLIDRLCRNADVEPSKITEGIAAGNTVMLHSLTGARLSGFASYPFEPEFLEASTVPSASLGFSTDFPLMLAGSLGPFVGADIIAGALASGILELERPALLIDFGTNGEILLKTADGFLATATAAGPAFEGGRLNCGAPAAKNVISALTRESGRWSQLHSIGEQRVRPSAISGAAYVDFLALARTEGLLNAMGRFESNHPEVETRAGPDGPECRVTIHSRLFVSESDVAELIQAKAAIAAGVTTLLEVADLRPDDLETIFIAGGFGYHLDRKHAMAVGMLPNVPFDRLRVIGNASLGGASLMLQSENESAIETLRANARVIELNQVESFEDHFIDCMPLDPLDHDR